MIGKLVVDYEEVSLGKLLEFLTEEGVECCVDGDIIYVYQSQPTPQRAIPNICEKEKIQNYFFKELTSPPTQTPTNYVQTWLLEKLREQEYARFEEKHQAELKTAQANIERAIKEYQELYTKFLEQQGGAADGGSKN